MRQHWTAAEDFDRALPHAVQTDNLGLAYDAISDYAGALEQHRSR